MPASYAAKTGLVALFSPISTREIERREVGFFFNWISNLAFAEINSDYRRCGPGLYIHIVTFLLFKNVYYMSSIITNQSKNKYVF